MYKIFLVEDDAVIAQAIGRHLQKWDFTVYIAQDFKDITGEFARQSPHLVLLDLTLPFYTGFYWCTELRKRTKTPIIFLSSASDNLNIVTAMDLGGDDFIAKPFDLAVLTAKVQAVLRRAYAFHTAPEQLSHGGLTLDLGSGVAAHQDKRVELTRNEHRILQLLMEQAGKAVARDALMLRLWQSDSFIDDNTLTVNVNRLRRKLESIGARDFILTQKGVGYIIR